MNALRLTSSLVIAALMTTSLFLLMQALITLNPVSSEPTEELHSIGFVDPIPEREITPDRPIKEPPPPEESSVAPEAPAILMPTNNSSDGPTIRASIAPPNVVASAPEFTNTRLDFGVIASNSPASVKNEIPPLYPSDQAMRGVTGYVKVRIMVSAAGGLADLQILESRPNRSFAKSVLAAVQRWQFNPAMRDGEAVPGVLEREFVFKLD